MEQPFMFEKATLFGAGEAGDEIMYGKENLLNDMKKAVSEVQNNSIVINVYGAQGQDVSELADIVADRINQNIQRQRAVFS